MSKGIAACVVLYNPSLQVISNIQSYYPFIDCLIAIDNSERKNLAIEEALRSNFDNLVYIYLDANPGIAGALNIACTTAIKQGYNWILTMDQDSSFVGNGLEKMIEDVAIIEQQFKRVGIITPHHVLAEEHKEAFTEAYSAVKVAMTSGSLLNLEAYKVAGAYDETLFMDFVDYEYCLRLRKNNYTIVQHNRVNLKHSLGNFQIKHFLGQRLGISNHNYQRRYYITRNSLHVGVKYYRVDKTFLFGHVLFNLALSPFTILLYEDNKLAKFKAMWKGVVHFFLGKRGKIQFS